MLSTFIWCCVVTLVTSTVADYVTWSGCPKATLKRVIQPFASDPAVTILDLNACNISNVESSNLAHPNLELVILSANGIDRLDASVFKSLTELRSLYLGYNHIRGRDLPQNLFEHNRKLERMGFTGNNMTGTPQTLLQGLDSLDTLWLDNCSLMEMPFFAAHPSLKQLFLQDNQIRALENPEKSIWLGNLLKIHLNNNLIQSIHSDFFKPMKKIEEIDLSDNKVPYLPDKLFENFTTLKTVELQNNLITFLFPDAFSGCSNLMHINLSYNRLNFLPDNFISQLNSLETLYFEDNVWQCGCLNELLKDVKAKAIGYRDIDNQGRVAACVSVDFQCHRSNERRGLTDREWSRFLSRVNT